MDNQTDKNKTIVVTGAAGFIGSCTVQFLNEQGYENLILVDSFGVEKKRRNWEGKSFAQTVEREGFIQWLNDKQQKVDVVIHLGARTDTTEFDYSIHEALNLNYSKDVWTWCVQHNVPLIYASSAATYGAGEHGYYDNNEVSNTLHPLNPYGISKNEFDKWALHQQEQPHSWAGLKFFNVYGPNEYHKGRMASVVYHAFHQIEKGGFVKLFRSYKEAYKDGEQLRDFIYVKDIVKILFWMMNEMTSGNWAKTKNGIYNAGTGKARTFNDLVKNTFKGMMLPQHIKYVDMPEDIRDKYQYFTEADMEKLRNAGYTDAFYSLEDGVQEYVREYLAKDKIW
ncbi:MAG: ADP-glyceromanno-heptose 6-epimerase [Bacteroidota bacterium]|nr:ADP-glyceromanno-heptose 6-epimerase [Bacteroidota bacterium]